MDFTPQPKKFRYTLNIRGVDEEVLENAPDTWLNTSIKFTRSQTYSGLLRSYTLPLKFTYKAATILRNEFFVVGFISVVKILIEKLISIPMGWDYATLYDGKIDFSAAETEDNETEFIGVAVNNDFSTNVDAYDSIKYAIPINVPQAINLELTPLKLKETATILPGSPPDGVIHSDYFPPITLVNNQQNSINASVQNVDYRQFRNPNYATDVSWFFNAQLDTKLYIQGTLNILSVNTFAGDKDIRLDIVDQNGNSVYKILEYNPISNGDIKKDTVNINTILNITKGTRLFLYMRIVNPEADGVGMTISGGQLNLSYQTISPSSMCKAVPAYYLFEQLLQAMNVNTDSGPNLPVPNRSFLLDPALNAPLKNLYITCSESIRAAVGSIYHAGDTIFDGVYKVLSGTATYNGNNYVTGTSFTFAQGVFTFTGDGVVQKTSSISTGNVYNPGDTLQAGGSYLVGGDAGTYIVYNSIRRNVGDFFDYVLGQDTFTGSDDSSYVLQTAEAPQMIISFADYYQSIKSIQGGDCAFGVDNGIAFIETLSNVYRKTGARVNMGNVNNWKFKPATDMMANAIDIGYKDQQYSVINAFAEVNSTQTYTTALLSPQTKLNLVSVIRADPYGIEEIRVTQQNTAASRSDNDLFFVWVKDAPEETEPVEYYHPLTTETLTSITGVDPSYYNWFLSPKQNLLRGSSYLASIFYNMKGYQITLANALKNNAMVTIDNNGRRVAEADPINISSLTAPYFIPMYCQFNPGIEGSVGDMVNSTPYADMKANVNGVVVKFFISEITLDESQNSQQEFKTLLSPDNDLTKFVY
jgi:hypothetical protein